MTARLGIGVPVYNGEKYLAQTLSSLRAQTYPDFEVLILDNASTDSSPAIAQAVVDSDPRFRLERKDVNTGGPSNFNDVFRRMNNELFAWCAADDLHQPTFFADAVAALDSMPGAIGGFTHVEMIDPEGEHLRDDDPDIDWAHPDPGHRMLDLISFKHACQTIFSVWRRPVMAAAEPMCTCWGSDRVMLAELALHGPVAISPVRSFLNRDHAGRVTHGKGRSNGYYGAARPHKAITFHYAAHLRRAIRNTPLTAAQRTSVHRAYGRWAIANTRNFARSAGRAVLESARPLIRR